MAGRYYRIKRLRRRGVNLFTADTYDVVCQDIVLANLSPSNKKNLIVQHAKKKMGTVAELLRDVLGYNNVKWKNYGKYLSSNSKTLFAFNSEADAKKAQEIVNKMALPDTVNRNRIKTDGSTVTNNGVKIKVDVDLDENGNAVLREGTTYIPSGSVTTTQQTQAEKSSGDLKKWIIIGGAALLVVVVVLVIMKKKKIIK